MSVNNVTPDDDLFGPSNLEYQQTTAISSFPPPAIPPANNSFPPRNQRWPAHPGGRGRNGEQYQGGIFPHVVPSGPSQGQWGAPGVPFGQHPRDHLSGNGWPDGPLARPPEPGYGGPPGQKRPRQEVAPAGMTIGQPRGEGTVAVMKLGAIGHRDVTLRTESPVFQKPQEIACYSRTSDGAVHLDDRCLRRFRPSVLSEKGTDLNRGYETFVDKREDGDPAPLQDLLFALRQRRFPLDNIHFVSFRNNLNKILGTCYDRDKAWEMGVHKRGITVYLDVRKLPEEPWAKTESSRRFTYYGYSFENIATESRLPRTASAASPSAADGRQGGGGARGGGAADGGVVDANAEFVSILKTRLGPHRVVLGAEIDCYEKDSHGGRHYLELKTSVELNDRNTPRFERDKLLRFWIQSFIAGVPRIICGFRDDSGHLVRSEVLDLPEICKRVKGKGYWEGGPCLAFADRVLTWLYGSLEDKENYVLRFLPAGSRLELGKSEYAPAALEEHCRLLAGEEP